MFLTLIALLMILRMLMVMEYPDPHLNTCVDKTAVVGLQLDVNLRRQREMQKGSLK